MGQCYCTEISAYKHRITKLQNCLKDVSRSEVHIKNTSYSLADLGTHNGKCYVGTNVSRINKEIHCLKNSMENRITELKDAVHGTIRRLQKDLDDMEKEDQRYHEEEDSDYEG